VRGARCVLFTYHGVIVVDAYIDSLQPLVYYRLNSAVLVYTSPDNPLLLLFVTGCGIKNPGVVIITLGA